MERGGYVYILSNKNNTTLYIGVTSNLKARIFEHRTKVYPKSFTAKYNCDKLVYYETFNSIEEAIEKEKKLKGGSRLAKEVLIDGMNSDWKDLYDLIDELG